MYSLKFCETLQVAMNEAQHQIKEEVDAYAMQDNGENEEYERLDQQLVSWLKDQQAQGHTVSNSDLEAQSTVFLSGFKASHNWLLCFKERHCITSHHSGQLWLPGTCEDINRSTTNKYEFNSFQH